MPIATGALRRAIEPQGGPLTQAKRAAHLRQPLYALFGIRRVDEVEIAAFRRRERSGIRP